MLCLTVIIFASAGVVAALAAQTSTKADRPHSQVQPAAVAQVAAVQRAVPADAQDATPDCDQVVASVLTTLSDLVAMNDLRFGPLSFGAVFFG